MQPDPLSPETFFCSMENLSANLGGEVGGSRQAQRSQMNRRGKHSRRRSRGDFSKIPGVDDDIGSSGLALDGSLEISDFFCVSYRDYRKFRHICTETENISWISWQRSWMIK